MENEEKDAYKAYEEFDFLKALELSKDFEFKNLINFKIKDKKALEAANLQDSLLFKLIFEDNLKFEEGNYFLDNYNLGVYFFRKNDFQKAYSFFLKSLQAKQDFFPSRNNLLICLEILGLDYESYYEAGQIVLDLNKYIADENKKLIPFDNLQEFDFEIFKNSDLSLNFSYLTSKPAGTLKDLSNEVFYYKNNLKLKELEDFFRREILKTNNLYIVYNFHVFLVGKLTLTKEAALEVLKNDYPDLEILNLYLSLLYLRSRDFYSFSKYLDMINTQGKYDMLFDFFKRNIDRLEKDEFIENFAYILRKFNYEHYLFFKDNNLHFFNYSCSFPLEQRIFGFFAEFENSYYSIDGANEQILEVRLKIDDLKFLLTNLRNLK